MPENRLSDIETRLADVPQGTVRVENHGDLSPSRPEEGYTTDGKGLVERWGVFPGVILAHSVYLAGRCTVSRPTLGSLLCHCHVGRADWDVRGDALSLGPGELALWGDVPAQGAFRLPLGRYEGIAISVDWDVFRREPPHILREAGVPDEVLLERLRGGSGCALFPAGPQTGAIFDPLYTLPPPLRLPYFRLKVQELLLFLSAVGEREGATSDAASRQVEIIRAIHRQLTEHPERRYTIEELSKQYLINTSSLKAMFKRVYGAPIAAYMKEYRIREAARLLRETQDSVGEIAAQVGYENQSKFSAAFQEVMKTLPTVYRRQRREMM